LRFLDHARSKFMPRIVTLEIDEWFRGAFGAGIAEVRINRLSRDPLPCLCRS
jgi:hypothetical protein